MSNVMEGLADEDEEGVFFFGRDITKVPCFKRACLNGIYAGLSSGLITFLATSRALPATHVSVGVFSASSLIFWFTCRGRNSRNNFVAQQTEATFPEEIENMKIKKLPIDQQPKYEMDERFTNMKFD